MIHHRVKEIMEEQGLTNQSEVARIVDMSRSALRQLLSDETVRIDFESIEKLCRGLNVTPNELFEIRNDDGSLWTPFKASIK